jgi:hypothetical protein
METKKTIKDRFLDVAELIDAYRVVPRLFLIVYGYMIYNVYRWFTAIETAVQTKCDAALIQVLIDHGKTLEYAEALACTVVDMVGGPTTAQTTFVTTIVGLSTAVFAFYANTGRSWGAKKNSENNSGSK